VCVLNENKILGIIHKRFRYPFSVLNYIEVMVFRWRAVYNCSDMIHLILNIMMMGNLKF